MMDQGSSGAGDGFEVTKFGHGRVALIGFPRLAFQYLRILYVAYIHHNIEVEMGKCYSPTFVRILYCHMIFPTVNLIMQVDFDDSFIVLYLSIYCQFF